MNVKQLSPCDDGSAAGKQGEGRSARGFAGAPDRCKGTTMESSWVPALSSGKEGMLLPEIWSIVKNKLEVLKTASSKS